MMGLTPSKQGALAGMILLHVLQCSRHVSPSCFCLAASMGAQFTNCPDHGSTSKHSPTKHIVMSYVCVVPACVLHAAIKVFLNDGDDHADFVVQVRPVDALQQYVIS